MIHHNPAPICVLPLNLTFYPVLRCGSASAVRMIEQQWPDDHSHGADFGTTVVMRRDPYERMESLYRWGGEPRGEPFSDWVVSVCTRDDADPHYLPQSVVKADIELQWDWKEFQRLFQIEPQNTARLNFGQEPGPLTWSDEAKGAFERKYASDIG